MVKTWGAGGGEKTFPSPHPPQIKGRKFWRRRVVGPGGRQGNQERDRKEEIHGGGGTRKEPRKREAARGARF